MSDQNSTNENNSTDGAHPEAQQPLVDVKALQEQSEKFKNDFLYLRAEFENYKRNAIKERAETLKYGSERLINEILNVVDNFERALQVKITQENLSTYTQGVQMTANELKSVLQRHGVAEVSSDGQPFDPNIHEALSSEPTTEVQEGHVYRVFKKAYKLHEKIIRPAQVVVARKPE